MMLKQSVRKWGILAALVAVLGSSVALVGVAMRPVQAADLGALAVDFDSLADKSGQFLSLSEVEPLRAQVGYGEFLKDQVQDGSKIALKYENGLVTFERGLWAHANSNLYYDLEALGAKEKNLDYFTAYVGLNRTSGGGNGVKFIVYGSNDPEILQGQHLTGADYWEVLYNPDGTVMMPGQAAEFLRVKVADYRFLRLQVDANGSNGMDHSVWADAKLVRQDYDPYVVPTAEAIDAELRSLGELDPIHNAEHELRVLRRDLVKNAGQYSLTQFIEAGPEQRETLEWLYNNLDVLRMWTTGGKPTGTYLEALEVLNDLYQAYKSDLQDDQPLKTVVGHKRSEMYQKMMLALSLTHSKQVRFWIRDQGEMAGNPESPDISRAVDRYAVYKRMYLAEKLNNRIFESLEVEEMREVMFTELGDDEIEWLRDWLPTINKGLYTYPPVPYISIGNHYWFDQNYDENYIDPKSGQTWAEKYQLIGQNYIDGKDKSISGNYKIGFEAKAPHLWMINYYGGVCWQISNFGQNMTASYGVPSTTFGQPGHLAFVNYELGNGVPAWALTNDVSGWSQSNYTGYTNTNTYHLVRQMTNWGATDGSYSLLRNRYGQQGSYLTMAQAAINDFEHYERAQVLVRTAEVYANDLPAQEEIYREALREQDFNFDAWYGLLANYLKRENMEAVDWYNLAQEIAHSRMKSFALPFHDLLQTIIAQIPTDNSATVGYALSTEMLLTETLEWMAENNTNTDIEGIFRQGGVSRTLANTLLGRLNNEIATFSFDGEEAGVLKLGAKYTDSSAAFEYSLDGGQTWLGDRDGYGWVTEKRIKLTPEQIASITTENDIKVHIQGVPREGNVWTIDIKEGTLPTNLYANDKENRVVGVTEAMEWREVSGEGEDKVYGDWVSYRAESPLRIGDITIQVRVGATGVFLPSPASEEYHFTKDTDPNTRKYIPVSHLSVAAMSSQATGGGQHGNAIYAIDGNFNTRWHSAWNGSDHDQWIVIKFDHQVELAALGYVQSGGGNGIIQEAEFYISNENELKEENFRLVGKVASDCSGAGEGVLCDPAWSGRWNSSTITNLNPQTFEFRRTEEGEDGQEVVTHEALTARYVAIKATLTSNGGNFVAARMLNFYEDRTQNPAPTAGVAYSTIEPTRGDVIARLVNTTEEAIEVVDENGEVLADGAEHVFTENGEWTFRFRRVGDPAKKEGTAIAKVDWIMKQPLKPEEIKIEYICVDENLGDGHDQREDCSSERGKTNRSVSVKLTFPEKRQVRILNNGYQADGDDDYGAEAPDPDKVKPDDGTSSDQDSLDPFTYLFMRNGKFTFRYVDVAGHEGELPVTVDWIDKAAPKVALEYSTKETTSGQVVAKLVSVPIPESLEGGMGGEDAGMDGNGDFELIADGVHDENGLEYGEKIVVLNNNGQNEHRFTRNGDFTFEYRDMAGNKGAITAKVDWIKEVERPGEEEKPEEVEKPGETERPGGIEEPSETEKPGNSGRPNGGSGPNDVATVVPEKPDQVGQPGVSDGDSGTKVEVVGLPDGVKPNRKPLVVDQKLKDKFGTAGEYFELEFVGENGEKVEAKPEKVKIEIARGKRLRGVYRVKDDGSLEPVEYKQVDETHIEIAEPGAGRYFLDYEEERAEDHNGEVNDPDEEKPVVKKKSEWYQNPLVLVAGGALVVIVLGVGGVMIYNRQR